MGCTPWRRSSPGSEPDRQTPNPNSLLWPVSVLRSGVAAPSALRVGRRQARGGAALPGRAMPGRMVRVVLGDHAVAEVLDALDAGLACRGAQPLEGRGVVLLALLPALARLPRRAQTEPGCFRWRLRGGLIRVGGCLPVRDRDPDVRQHAGGNLLEGCRKRSREREPGS